jgi:hypothetical protein
MFHTLSVKIEAGWIFTQTDLQLNFFQLNYFVTVNLNAFCFFSAFIEIM